MITTPSKPVYLSGSCNVEFLQEVVHDEDGDNHSDEDWVGEANYKNGSNHIEQLKNVNYFLEPLTLTPSVLQKIKIL